MKLNRIAAAAMLLAPLALPAHALITVTPLLGFYNADQPSKPFGLNGVVGGKASKLKIDDGVYAGLAAGVQFFPSWSLEAEYGKSGDTQLLSGNLLISPESWGFGRVTPYVLTGLARSSLDYKIVANNAKGKSTDTDINLGGGFTYTLNHALAVRGELRAVHNSDHSLTNYLALAGLQYNFGVHQQAEQPEVPATPVQPALPADTDGDGVIDANDRCPNTPAGWAVGVDGCPLDSDHDKVPDSIDECPNTPIGQPVGANGCPLDDDNDGVPNAQDKCPGTPPNVVVDENGCPKVLTQKIEQQINIVFDSGKAIIKPEFKPEVAKIADLAKQYPDAHISIEGHTDNSGKAASNMLLSQQRANAVRMMLINEFKVDAGRLSAQGFGSSKPVADNTTAEGKLKNRRVVAVVTGDRQVTETKSAPAKKAVKGKKGGKKAHHKAVKKAKKK